MAQLKIGYARADITPMRGIPIAGYFIERNMEGVLDELYLRAMAAEIGSNRLLFLSVDNLQIQTHVMNGYRKTISEATGVPVGAIFIHCTHTHTSSYVDIAQAKKFGVRDNGTNMKMIEDYQCFLGKRMRDTSLAALEDLTPSRMGFGTSKAENVAFLRRYRMKDGSVRTNPGVGNPEILEPIGVLDETVSVLRFDRDGKSTVVLVNFANHPDVVGGNRVSADWPGFLCRTLEKTLDNTDCLFFNGAQGDVNHVNVHPTKGYLNDLFMDFDDVARGYGHARHIGRVVAGAVLQIYDKVEYIEPDAIRFCEKIVDLPSNMPSPDEMPEARRINELHLAGRDAELPYEGMMLTTKVAEAGRMIELEHGPETFPMPLIAVSIGKVAFVGIPGEPFNKIGIGIKEASGWDMIVPCCLTNGSEGYFPVRDAYDEGGYESRSSIYKAGVAELIVKEGKALLDALRK